MKHRIMTVNDVRTSFRHALKDNFGAQRAYCRFASNAPGV